MWAAQNCRKDVVELLLAAKANLSAKDQEGHTALSLARSCQQKDVVEVLEKAGAPTGAAMELNKKEVSPKAAPKPAGK